MSSGSDMTKLIEATRTAVKARKAAAAAAAAGPPRFATRDDFEITTVLGKGAYGRVFLVRKKSGGDNGHIYAMKVINKSKIADSNTDQRHTRTERDVLVKVDHPFLIKLCYAFETDARLYLVQEFCRGGELFR
jgi:p70 ribosomal S6 kinase